MAADPGDSAQLTCQVDGNPTPSIFWAKEGFEGYLGSKAAYDIDTVGESDFGVYTCTARVTGFPDNSLDVHLMKKGKWR